MFCLVPNSIESKNRERRAIGIFSPIANHQKGPVKLTIEEEKINYQTGKGETKTLPFKYNGETVWILGP